MRRSHKYRVYPTQAQAELLASWQATCLDIQRWAIQQRRAYSYWRGVLMLNPEIAMPSGLDQAPTWVRQSRDLTQLKKARPDWREPPDDVTRAILKRVDQAYTRMFANIKAGVYRRRNAQRIAQGRKPRPPKVYWPRRAADVSLQFRGEPERGTRQLDARGRLVRWQLASSKALGPLRVRMHRPIPEGVSVQQATLTRAADGWYVSFSCVLPDPAPAAGDQFERPLVGVDVGAVHDVPGQQRMAILDDGRVFRSPDHLAHNLDQLAHRQRMVSPDRKVYGTAKAASPTSKRTAKRHKQIARLHQRVTRQRDAQQQYIARRIVDGAEVVAVEGDVDWRAMREQVPGTGKVGRRANRSMSTAAPAKLLALIDEKAEASGQQVIKVVASNTTQACSACGVLADPPVTLQDRRWTCRACGVEHDQDVNAARNIATRAREG